MGKATRWLKGLFGIKSASRDPTPGKSGISGVRFCHNSSTIPPNITPAEVVWLRSYNPQAELERNKHAIAVAAATASAADAAVAAAQAAAEVVRLSRGQSISNSVAAADAINWAAVRIQSNFRGYLARKALRALKGLVKIQALVRGFLVRKQATATATLHGMQALFRAQASAQSKRASYNMLKRGSGRINTQDRPEPLHWARPSLGEFGDHIETGQYYNAPVRSRRLSASFEARALDPPTDDPKVVEVDPSSYHMISPQLHFHFQSHSQFAPSRLSVPSCCHGKDALQRQQLLYYQYPNYMAKTMSFKAKLRSQSAPKQRVETNGKRSNVSDKKRMYVNEPMR